jgi:ferric-dicitrate binding protein FerR (iron transport regulator)
MSDGQDLMRRIASAGRRIDPCLSDRDVERLVAAALRQRQRRAMTLRAVLAAGAAVSLALAGGLIFRRAVRRAPLEVAAASATGQAPLAQRILRLSDGSTAVALDPETEIELVDEHPDRVGLSLVRGRGRFEVTPRPTRTFQVRAGDVTVTVVGTVFTVERVGSGEGRPKRLVPASGHDGVRRWVARHAENSAPAARTKRQGRVASVCWSR